MSPISRFRSLVPFAATLALCVLAAPMGTAYAKTTDLGTTPPDVAVAVAPNIAVTFDDSGSMGATSLPDSLDGTSGNNYYYSSNTNYQYYNPAITYTPPLKADGVTRFPDAPFGAAWRDGICANKPNTSNCTKTVNLGTAFPTKFVNITTSGKQASEDGASDALNPDKGGAFYYQCPTVGSNTGCVLFLVRDAVKGESATGTKKFAGKSQQQNFANWYSYYRTRNLMTRSAMANVFAGLGKNIRVAWQQINAGTKIAGGTTTFDAFADTARTNFFTWLYAVGAKDGTASRIAVEAASSVFTYGKGVTTNKNPYWETDPSNATTGKELSCRLNYSLLVTDGYWNGGGPTQKTPTARDAVNLPDGVAYSGAGGDAASKIFWAVPSTTYSTLGDIAFYYWATNLRPDFKNAAGKAKLDVPPSFTDYTDQEGNAVSWDGTTPPVPPAIYFNPANDPATWPHVVQFMIALGINGTLAFPDDYKALRSTKTGNKTWPQPVEAGNAGQAANLDDTWHAAVNSRGQYFSARDPAALSSALSTLLIRILGRNTTPAAGALSSSVLTGSGVVYQTAYNSANYSGKLTANSVDVDGNVGAVLWNAADILTARTKGGDSRVILTSTAVGAGKGAAFTSAAAGAALKAVDSTISSDMIAYLRGDSSKEGTTFRTRASALGAIINSQTAFVAAPSSGYRDEFPPSKVDDSVAPEMEVDKTTNALLYSYEKFVVDHAKRAPTIYVGANDGMLHAFDATLPSTDSKLVDVTPDPGKERWAYVPFSVYDKLSYLTPPSNFSFRPTVDGTPVTRDVFFSSGTKGWHTILVGGLRLGGRGVYALDVTDAATTEAGASTKVLWEFNNTSTGGANLGYTYGRPNIGRLANGKWVVLVPSGYFPSDTTTKPYDTYATDAAAKRTQSSLFVLDAQTGAVIREISTTSGVNSYGLTSPVLGDYDNDQVDDVAFAGDMVGNLWRFDFSSADPAAWTVSLAYQPDATGDASKPGPEEQPITVMPRLFPDPTSSNFIVVFGTGRYLSASDNTINDSMKFQSIYGIRDRGPGSTTGVTGRTTLIKQDLAEQDSVRALTQRPVPATTDKGDVIDGWFIDLVINSGGSQTNKGERVVVDATALFDSGRAIITSLIPGNDDPCNPVRRGAVLVIDAATGGAATGVNVGTGSFGAGFAVAGIRVENVPISGSLPAATAVGGGRIVLPGLTIDNADGTPGASLGLGDAVWRRRSWRELNNGQ